MVFREKEDLLSMLPSTVTTRSLQVECSIMGIFELEESFTVLIELMMRTEYLRLTDEQIGLHALLWVVIRCDIIFTVKITAVRIQDTFF